MKIRCHGHEYASRWLFDKFTGYGCRLLLEDVVLLHIPVENPVFYLFAALIITSLAKEVMFLVALVCLFVCGHYSKSYKRIGMKFYGVVLGSTMKN